MSSEVAELDRNVGELPDDWREVVLSDVAEVNPEALRASTPRDFTFGYIDISQIDGPGQCAGWSEQTFGEAPSRARRKVRAGDILVSTVRPYLRSFAQVPQANLPLVASTGFAVVRAGPEADQQFLYQHILHDSFIEHLTPRMTGSNYPAVSASDVEAYPIALPPIDEQRRIAEVLQSVDEAIAAADMVARQWAAAFGTLLDVAFLEGEPASLSDICSLIYRYPGFYGFDQFDAGVPVIRGEHLRSGRISRDWEDFYYVDPAFSARFPKTILELDDVVMSVRGTVGTTAIVDTAHVGSQISPNLIRLVADPAKIMPPLLYYAVQSAVAHIRRTIVNAQALPAINAGDLKQVVIALPPLADQPALLAELNGAASACADAVSATQQARRTKAMVMSDLLSGHVRVPA